MALHQNDIIPTDAIVSTSLFHILSGVVFLSTKYFIYAYDIVFPRARRFDHRAVGVNRFGYIHRLHASLLSTSVGFVWADSIYFPRFCFS